MRSVPLCRITAHLLLIARAHQAGEAANMNEEMMELMSTDSEMIEEVPGNHWCGGGYGRLGAGEH